MVELIIMNTIEQNQPEVVSSSLETEAPGGLKDYEGLVRVISEAWQSSADETPVVPNGWEEETKVLLAGQWQTLSLISQKTVRVLSALANFFPDCSTLEIFSRIVARANEVNLKRLHDRFVKLQRLSEKEGSGSAFPLEIFACALIPAITVMDVPKDEREFLTAAATLFLSVPIVLSLGKKRDPDPWKDTKEDPRAGEALRYERDWYEARGGSGTPADETAILLPPAKAPRKKDISLN